VVVNLSPNNQTHRWSNHRKVRGMEDIYSEIVRVLKSGTPAALATVIETRGSSPRGVGAKFLVPKDCPTTGSVGAGCLEAPFL